MQREILYVAAAISLFVSLPVRANSNSAPTSPDKSPEKSPAVHSDIRIIRFPKCAAGRLRLIGQNDFVELKGSDKLPRAGVDVKITVPPGQYLELDISGVVVRHPNCLREISAAGIDAIEISNMSSFADDASAVNPIMHELVKFKGLQTIHFERADLTEDAFSILKNFRKLKSIRMFMVEGITGSSFNALTNCPELSDLDFRGCLGIRNENLKYLASLRSLQQLHLEGVKLNAIGIKNVAQCVNLKALYLRDSGVTDAQLLDLLSLKQLETLTVSKCPVTAKGVLALAPLKLKQLVVPAFLGSSPPTMLALKRAFPHASISFPHESNAEVTGEAMKWFSK